VIARTSGGAIDIAWIDDFDTKVRFATDATGSFVTTTLATDAGVGTGCDLAIAASGQPHVAFMSKAPPVQGVPGLGVRACVHATFSTGAWTREDVESGNDNFGQGVGAAGSLAFTSDGMLHAVYLGTAVQASSQRTMRHARLTQGGWEEESIATVSTTKTRLVAGSGDTLHVGVQWFTNVVHLRGTWGSWTTDTLTGAAKSGASIALSGTSALLPFSDATGVYSAAIASDGSSVTTTIDRTSEPLLKPSVAVDAQGSARFAVVRDDALGVHVDVIRRDGAAWHSDVVATGVSKTARPSLRVDGAGASHVAFAAANGTIRVATDAGGTWTTQDFVATAAVTTFALALGPDATRYLVFHQSDSSEIDLAYAAPGAGPTNVPVAGMTTGSVECDVAVGAGGIVHVAWIDTASHVHHASGPTSAFVADADLAAAGDWGATYGLDLVLDAAGHPWMSFSIPWQLYDFADVATNADGVWKVRGVGTGDDLAIGFAADGSFRAAGIKSGAAQRYRPGAPNGLQEIIDAGPGALRAFAATSFTVTEDGPPLAVGIVAAPSEVWLGSRVTLFGGAVDAVGGVHGAYVDRQTGDLRYVTDRDPGRATTATLDVSRSGGDASADDAAVAPSRVSFAGDDDSGTRFVTVTAATDGLDEADETLVLALGAQTATPAIGKMTTSIVIHDGDPTPPPPPPPPPPVYHGSYFLPTTARMPAIRGFEATGILHAGDAAFDPSAPGTIAIGAHTVNVPGLRARRGSPSAWSWSAGGARFMLQRVRGSASRYRFTLRLPRSGDDPDLSTPFDVSYTTDTLTAASRVSLVKGRIDVARGTGWFEAPPLHVDSLAATTGYAGRVSLSAFVADLRLRPQTAPTVTLSIGSAFTVTLQPSDFHADGTSWIAGDAAHRIVLDYETGLVRATFQRVAVGAPTDGVSTLDVTVDAGAGPRTLRTQVTTHRGRFGD
jgi:hypothetical protein